MLDGVAAGMATRGSDVYIVMPNLCRSGLTCNNHRSAPTSRELLGTEFTSDVVIRDEHSTKWQMTSWPDERQAAQEVLRSADVLVILGSALMYSSALHEIAAMVSMNRGRRLLVLPFPMLEVEYYAGPSQANLLYSRIHQIAALADEVLVASEYCAAELTKRSFVIRPIRVVRLGVDDRWRSTRNHIGKRDVVCISRMGRLARHKNIDVLLSAWKLFQEVSNYDVRLVLIGHGSKHIAAGHERVLPVENANDWLVRQHLGRALVLVHPSEIEAFGLSVAEGLAAGLPVVATRATAIPELVHDAVNGLLVDPDESLPLACHPRLDPGKLCDSLLRVTQDAELRGALASNSAMSVEDLTWSKTVASYLDE